MADDDSTGALDLQDGLQGPHQPPLVSLRQPPVPQGAVLIAENSFPEPLEPGERPREARVGSPRTSFLCCDQAAQFPGAQGVLEDSEFLEPPDDLLIFCQLFVCLLVDLFKRNPSIVSAEAAVDKEGLFLEVDNGPLA